MTPESKPDWADIIASKIAIDDYQYDCAAALREVARKNKADGMREAANHCGNPEYAPTADRRELANCFDNEADKIALQPSIT